MASQNVRLQPTLKLAVARLCGRATALTGQTAPLFDGPQGCMF